MTAIIEEVCHGCGANLTRIEPCTCDSRSDASEIVSDVSGLTDVSDLTNVLDVSDVSDRSMHDTSDTNEMWDGNDTNDTSDASDTNSDVTGLGDQSEEGRHALYSVSLSSITETATEWLIPGLIPASEAIILVGDEGIGKGLYWINLTAQVTTGPDPIDVLLIVAEDDLSRTVKPRLLAAGADVTRVHAIVVDPETLTGVPLLPNHSRLLAEAIENHSARLVIIDPWLSTVPGALTVKDPQQARQALDPVTRLARRTGASVILVAHTNRTSGSLRDRYGSTSVLRQVARVAVVAAEDPDDDTILYVGVEKSNISERGGAAKFRKVGSGARWSLETLEADVSMTIRELVLAFDSMTDGRISDKWPSILQAAIRNGGGITREQIVEVYSQGLTDEKERERAKAAANRALQRWVHGKPKRLERADGSTVYTLAEGSDETEGPKA